VSDVASTIPRALPAGLVRWLPKSVVALRTYSWTALRHDIVAGGTVGLVALPLAIAFAIASGLPPQAGIYCAVVTGFLISALGGSNVQIGGPTGAFVVVVAGIVAAHGVIGLYICTMMAGVMLVALGLTRSGSAIRYIPRPVVNGFTAGIAVVIASTQLRDVFGLQLDKVPASFLERILAIGRALPTLNPAAVAVGAATVLVIVATNRWWRAVPGIAAGLIACTAATWLLALPVETIGSRFGALPARLPIPHIPTFSLVTAVSLLGPALTVAMLGAIESLLSAVVADRLTGDRHEPNVELVAQGIANIVSPMFGGLPATGAIARTATNVRAGARTPVAGMIHAVVLLALLLFGAPLASRIPMAGLAAILLVVSFHMGEWHHLPRTLRQTRTDVAIWLVTFALTVLADLTVAVQVGMVLAALLYIRRVAATTSVEELTNEALAQARIHTLHDREIPPDVSIVVIRGPFLFGATEQLRPIVDRIDRLPPIVIFRLRFMSAIDATGVHALEDVALRLRASGRTAIFCGARDQPAAALARAGFADVVGAANVCPHIQAALDRARQQRAA